MNFDTEREEASRAIARGNKATSEFELLEEAFTTIRTVALETAVNSRPEDVALRERMIITAQLIDGVKTAILRIAEDGDAAREYIETLIKREDQK